jgi:hypothetical protein
MCQSHLTLGFTVHKCKLLSRWEVLLFSEGIKEPEQRQQKEVLQLNDPSHVFRISSSACVFQLCLDGLCLMCCHVNYGVVITLQ